MSRKSQVEKFNRKWSKHMADEEAVQAANAKAKINEDIQGVEELKKKGNIEEAAVVFSREGMGLFANMFGNSIERAVTKVLTEHMDNITKNMQTAMDDLIEIKMTQMLEGMTEGIRQFTEQQAEEVAKQKLKDDFFAKFPVTKELADRAKEQFASALEEPPEDEAILSASTTTVLRPKKKDKPSTPRPKKGDYLEGISTQGLELKPISDINSPKRLGSGKEDTELVSEYILSIMKKYKGEVVRSADIVKILREEYGVVFTNPTLIFRKVMTIDPNMENVGFGLYKYEEKNFKPTL